MKCKGWSTKLKSGSLSEVIEVTYFAYVTEDVTLK